MNETHLRYSLWTHWTLHTWQEKLKKMWALTKSFLFPLISHLCLYQSWHLCQATRSYSYQLGRKALLKKHPLEDERYLVHSKDYKKITPILKVRGGYSFIPSINPKIATASLGATAQLLSAIGLGAIAANQPGVLDACKFLNMFIRIHMYSWCIILSKLRFIRIPIFFHVAIY